MADSSGCARVILADEKEGSSAGRRLAAGLVGRPLVERDRNWGCAGDDEGERLKGVAGSQLDKVSTCTDAHRRGLCRVKARV